MSEIPPVDPVDYAEFKARVNAKIAFLLEENREKKTALKLIAQRLFVGLMAIIGGLVMILFGIVRSKIGL